MRTLPAANAAGRYMKYTCPLLHAAVPSNCSYQPGNL
jgi:hypothetical protein